VLAVHDASGIPVAIKYLSDRLFTDKDFLSRFRVAARLLAGLRDPHLVRFYEYVETGGAAAVIMELVDGVNLRELLRRAGRTGPEAALAVLKGSLLGLAAAHAAGVAHGDCKPANVLIDGDGNGKLADVAMAPPPAKVPASISMTVPSGTPMYLAPERWAGGPATPASDVYAATAVFFECVTGRPPYERPTMAQLARAHATAPIPVKQIPEPLWVMFAHGLAKDPLDRPPTAAMFLEEVEEAARAAYGPRWETRGRTRLAEMAAPLVVLFPLAEPPGRIASALRLTRLGKERSKTLATAGAGLIVIMAGAGTAALQTGQDARPPTTLAAPMSTPRAVPEGARPRSGPGGTPSPSPSWSMPGGLPGGDWTAPTPGTLPTTPVANPSPIGGVPPGPGSTAPGGGGTRPGGTTPGGGSTGGPPGGSTGGGSTAPATGPGTSPPPTTEQPPPTTEAPPATEEPSPPLQTSPAADPSGSDGAGLK
jgi:serine/threonine-protein kinase